MTPEELLSTYGPREAMEYDVVVVGAGPGTRPLRVAVRPEVRAGVRLEAVRIV